MASQGFRFLLSGGTLFALDFAVFVFCRKVLGIDVAISELCARTVGAVTGFVLHKFFTFANGGNERAMSGSAQGAGYFATTGFNILFSPFLVWWLVGLLHPYELVAKVIGSGLLACETFLVFRFLFRSAEPDVSTEDSPAV